MDRSDDKQTYRRRQSTNDTFCDDPIDNDRIQSIRLHLHVYCFLVEPKCVVVNVSHDVVVSLSLLPLHKCKWIAHYRQQTFRKYHTKDKHHPLL
jgi:hypothetical protein